MNLVISMVAKKCGVHIYEFSIGMGPLIWKRIGKDKIQYSIRALPTVWLCSNGWRS